MAAVGALSGRTIGVTGATGFLGSHIALELLARGAEVVGVVRSPEKGAWLAERGLQLRRGDLGDVASLSEAFAGCDALVSNAALATRQRARMEEFERANVTGVAHVMEACEAAKTRRVVHVSTVGVYRARLGRPMNEDTPMRLRFRLDPSLLTTQWRYGVSKAKGELLAWKMAEANGTALTTVRPGPIYGSRDTKFTASMIARAQSRIAVVPRVKVPMVHAGDVAVAIAGALENPKSEGKAYNLGGQSHWLPDVVREVRDVIGSSCWVVGIPIGLGVVFDDRAAEKDLGLCHRSMEAGWREAVG